MSDKPNAAKLLERAKKCRVMIGNMCAEGRPPKMQIPAAHNEYNEDFYITDTLDDLATEVVRLEAQVKYQEETWATANSELEARGREIKRLEARVKELEGALGFYADPDTYNTATSIQISGFCADTTQSTTRGAVVRPIEQDWGYKAKSALAKKEGE